MKKLIVLLTLIPSLALAQGATNICASATGVYSAPTCSGSALTVAVTGVVGVALPNDSYLTSVDAAGTGSLSLLKADATDDTVLNAKTGELIKLSENGTAGTTIDPSTNGYTFASLAEFGADSATNGIDAMYFSNGTAKGSIAYSTNTLQIGATTAHSVDLIANNLPIWQATTGGNLTQNATNGGNIVITKSNTGVLSGGLAAYPADVYGWGYPTFLSWNHQIAQVQGSLSATGGEFGFMKSRATDGSADVAVSDGDAIGSIIFYGANGADFTKAAVIKGVVGTGSGGGTDMPGQLLFQVSPDGSGTPATALTIGSDKSTTLAGILKSTATNVGWVIRTGADTACDTTCTAAHGCVFGQNTAALGYNIVACNDVTADVCVCSF